VCVAAEWLQLIYRYRILRADGHCEPAQQQRGCPAGAAVANRASAATLASRRFGTGNVLRVRRASRAGVVMGRRWRLAHRVAVVMAHCGALGHRRRHGKANDCQQEQSAAHVARLACRRPSCIAVHAAACGRSSRASRSNRYPAGNSAAAGDSGSHEDGHPAASRHGAIAMEALIGHGQAGEGLAMACEGAYGDRGLVATRLRLATLPPSPQVRECLHALPISPRWLHGWRWPDAPESLPPRRWIHRPPTAPRCHA
jgi:hypothetical protein